MQVSSGFGGFRVGLRAFCLVIKAQRLWFQGFRVSGFRGCFRVQGLGLVIDLRGKP